MSAFLGTPFPRSLYFSGPDVGFKFLHGFLSKKNRRIPMKIKFWGPPPSPLNIALLGFFRFFFENRRRGLAKLLKLYKVVILTEKETKNPTCIARY